MPLVRYEVRCEHSLANPELYRTAGRDDSEGLLEGVAMAGLVGIVRQLGDMAEYVFQILLNCWNFRASTHQCCSKFVLVTRRIISGHCNQSSLTREI